MEIQYIVDQGQKRRSNQDYAAIFQNLEGYQLLMIADGMGGHLAGDVASKMTVEEMGRLFETTDIKTPEKASQWFVQTLQKENQRIYEKGQEDTAFFGMGTTVVAAIVFPETFVLAYVGDSRAYLLQGEKLKQITMDHSLVQVLVNEGEITPEMARVHPQKNIVTRSIGMPGHLEVDVLEMPYTNELLLLCTDGLTNMVEDTTIEEVLTSDLSNEKKAAKLVEEANINGGFDNITVMLVDFEKGKGK